MYLASAAVSQHYERVMTVNDYTTIPLRVCTKCQRVLPATTFFFHRHKDGKYGLFARCKDCIAERDRKYQEKNPEKIQQKNKRYYQENRDKAIQKQREYRVLNPEKVVEQKRRFYVKHRVKILEQKREIYSANRKLHSDKNRKYRETNVDKLRLYRISRRAQNRINTARRAARKRSLPDTFTQEQWIMCLEYFNYCCAVCGNQLRNLFNTIEPHADHWIPLVSPECLGTVAENMVCLCNHCNHTKQAIMPDVWLERKYGKRKAREILTRIQAYFASLA